MRRQAITATEVLPEDLLRSTKMKHLFSLRTDIHDMVDKEMKRRKREYNRRLRSSIQEGDVITFLYVQSAYNFRTRRYRNYNSIRLRRKFKRGERLGTGRLTKAGDDLYVYADSISKVFHRGKEVFHRSKVMKELGL